MKLLVILTVLPILSARSIKNFSDKTYDICNPGEKGFSDCQSKEANCESLNYDKGEKKSYKCECAPGKSFTIEDKCVEHEICSPNSVEHRICSSGNAKCEKDKDSKDGYKCVCQRGEYINNFCEERLPEDTNISTETPTAESEVSNEQPGEPFSEQPEVSTIQTGGPSSEQPEVSTIQTGGPSSEQPEVSTIQTGGPSSEQPEVSTIQTGEPSSKQPEVSTIQETTIKFEISTKPVKNTQKPAIITVINVENNSTDNIDTLNIRKSIEDVILYQNKTRLDKNLLIMILGAVLGVLILITISVIAILVYRRKKFQNSTGYKSQLVSRQIQ